MVRVVPGVPDSDILEQTSVRPQNVVSPGPHHLSLSLHVQRLSVPTPPSPSLHEMLRHIFYSRCRQIRRYVLLPSFLRRQDVHVKTPRHHQFRSRRLASYCIDHRLHGHFVLRGDVCPDNVPASLSRGVCPSAMAPPLVAPVIASVPPDIAALSPGVHPVNTQGPCNGPCCARGPGQRHS